MSGAKAVAAGLLAALAAMPACAGASGRLGLQGGFVAAEFVRAAAGGGIHFDVGFPLGTYGSLHYYPNADVWMKTRERAGWFRQRHMEVALNLADIRYYPPVAARIVAKPYIGAGAIGVLAFLQEETQQGWEPLETEFHPGADFFGGCDFVLTKHLALFVELKGKSNGRTAFKMFGGLALLL
jgi:hypothetical protein